MPKPEIKKDMAHDLEESLGENPGECLICPFCCDDEFGRAMNGEVRTVYPLEDLSERINALIDQYRARVFWSNHCDWYPMSKEAQQRALQQIKCGGDVQGFRKASDLLQKLG